MLKSKIHKHFIIAIINWCCKLSWVLALLRKYIIRIGDELLNYYRIKTTVRIGYKKDQEHSTNAAMSSQLVVNIKKTSS